MPSGREEAIETLVDMDPQGNFFRAARVLVRLSVAFVGIIPRRSTITFELFPIRISPT